MEKKFDWDEVVESLGPKLYRYFCSTFSESVADDLTQETFLRLVRKVESGDFDPNRGSLDKFAFGMAYFIRLESIKKSYRDSYEQFDEEVAVDEKLLEDIVLEKLTSQELKNGIGKLPLDQQNIITLLIERDLTLHDISLILNLPLGTIKSYASFDNVILINLS